MSIDHACALAELLDVSLDWLLLGRNAPDWFRAEELTDLERDLVSLLRARPSRIGRLLVGLVREISTLPREDMSPT